MKCLSLIRLAICFVALLAWFVAPEVASAQLDLRSSTGIGFGSSAGAKIVKTSAFFTAPKADHPAMLYVTAEIAPDWHIYSITQPPGGPVKSKIKITEAPDFKLAGEFKAINPPAVHHYDDIWPGLPVEEYEKKATWAVPIEIAAGVDLSKLQISARCMPRPVRRNVLRRRITNLSPGWVPPIRKCHCFQCKHCGTNCGHKRLCPGNLNSGLAQNTRSFTFSANRFASNVNRRVAPGYNDSREHQQSSSSAPILRPAGTFMHWPTKRSTIFPSRRSSYSPKRLACISNRRGPSGRPLRWPAV